MKRILIVEDDKSLRDILEKKLFSEDFAVITCSDGDRAMELVFSDNPDLVLLDIMIPKLDGKTVLREIRNDPRGKDIPIIIMSNLDYSVHASEMAPFMINGYIVKSTTKLEEIVEKIKATLNQS